MMPNPTMTKNITRNKSDKPRRLPMIIISTIWFASFIIMERQAFFKADRTLLGRSDEAGDHS